MERLPDYYRKETLVLGCGNILFGDDGLGPAVADYLNQHYQIPKHTAVVNLGLATRGFIFDILLSEQKPKRIVIVDAAAYDGKQPGEIFEVPLDNLTKGKVQECKSVNLSPPHLRKTPSRTQGGL